MEKVAAYEEMIWDDILEKEAMNRFDREMWDVARVHAAGAPLPTFKKGRLGKHLDNTLNARHNLLDERFKLRQAIQDMPQNSGRFTRLGYERPSKILDFSPTIVNTGLSNKSHIDGKRRAALSRAIERNKKSDAIKNIPNHLKSYF